MRRTNDKSKRFSHFECLSVAVCHNSFCRNANRNGKAMQRLNAVKPAGALVVPDNRRAKMLVRRPKRSFKINVELARRDFPN
jgi:hypothetical protein